MNVTLTDEQIQKLLKNASADTLRTIITYLLDYFGEYSSISDNIVTALISMPSSVLTKELTKKADSKVLPSLDDGVIVRYISYNPISNSINYEVVDEATGDVKSTSRVFL